MRLLFLLISPSPSDKPLHHGSNPMLPHPLVSEVEADDELEADHGKRRVKPATRRAHIRQNFEKSLERKESKNSLSPKRSSGTVG